MKIVETSDSIVDKTAPVEVHIQLDGDDVTVEDIKKLTETLVDMQKGCSCHCTLSVKLPWLRFE